MLANRFFTFSNNVSGARCFIFVVCSGVMNEVSASSSIENILLKLEEHAAACDQRPRLKCHTS